MKLSGSHVIPTEQERSFQLLQDSATLCRCMPGCDRLEKISDAEYRMKLKMMIGSLSGLFDGTIAIADSQPPHSFRLKVTGKGKIGFVNAEGLIKLAPAGDATQVSYDGDVQVGGLIASVGQRLLDGTSRLIINKFFANFSSACQTS